MSRPTGVRRFIAGAVCAACGAVDRTIVERGEDGERVRCVNCGATRAKPPAGSNYPGGRLATSGSRSTESARPVRLLDPGRLDADT